MRGEVQVAETWKTGNDGLWMVHLDLVINPLRREQEDICLEPKNVNTGKAKRRAKR